MSEYYNNWRIHKGAIAEVASTLNYLDKERIHQIAINSIEPNGSRRIFQKIF